MKTARASDFGPGRSASFAGGSIELDNPILATSAAGQIPVFCAANFDRDRTFAKCASARLRPGSDQRARHPGRLQSECPAGIIRNRSPTSARNAWRSQSAAIFRMLRLATHQEAAGASSPGPTFATLAEYETPCDPSSKDDTCERRLDLAVDRCRIRHRCRYRFKGDSHNPGGNEYLSMVVRRLTRDRVTGLTFPDYHRVSAAGRPRRGRKCACFRRTWLVLPSACASAGPRP